MQTGADELRELDLRAHTLLADVPLHDVWVLDLPGDGRPRTIADVRAIMAAEELTRANPIVRALFAVRGAAGRWLGWDRETAGIGEESFLHRLSEDDRRHSLVPPGTREGPFHVLYVGPAEAISEIRNATVHAFSVLALAERGADFRLYWAIYVRPVGRITAAYMALIDPFRRLLVYPAVLRYVRTRWERERAV